MKTSSINTACFLVVLTILSVATQSFGQVDKQAGSTGFLPLERPLNTRAAGFFEWEFFVDNTGLNFHDFFVVPFGPGGEFPRETNNFLIWNSAFGVGVLKDTTANSVTYRYTVSDARPANVANWMPGPVLPPYGIPFDSLMPDDPGTGDNIVYVIDTCRCRDDWLNWPGHDGAPVDSLGNPLLISQQDSWAVFNDVDTLVGMCDSPDSQPCLPPPTNVGCYGCTTGLDSPIRGIGVEVHQSSYTFGAAPGTILMRWKVFNRTNVTYDSTYFEIGFDPDVVSFNQAGNDQIGTDTTRKMIYAYSNSDVNVVTGQQYAVGAKIVYFSGLPGLTSSDWQTASWLSQSGDIGLLGYREELIGDTTHYFEMAGLDFDGTPRLASEGFVEADHSPFIFPGDPVTQLGLRSGSVWPQGADVRGRISVGPFQLQPGIEYDWILAIIGGEHPDRPGAITDLRNDADHLQTLFDNQIGYLLGVNPTFTGPVAEFGVSSRAALPGEPTYFYDWALVNPQDPTTTWKWDFDNDGTIDYQSTNHWNRPKEWSYVLPGVYSVKLVVTDAAGSDSLVKDSLITVYAPVATPFLDEFDSAPDPNPAVWINTTTRISDKADEPPSSPFALAIDGHPDGPESITSYPFDLTGLEDSAFVLCFSYQPQGNASGGGRPEPEDSLIVEFRNDLNQWIKVQSFPGEGKFPFKTDTVYIDSVEGMMGTFFHDLFQFRFRGTAEQSGAELKDVWFVDDVYLGKLDPNHPTDIATGFGSNIPRVFKLHQNYPNPFNPSTKIKYDLPKDSKVTITIFNVLGQEVRTLVDEPQTAGYRSVVWNGTNNAGFSVSSGVYVYRIEAGEFVQSKKMMLLR